MKKYIEMFWITLMVIGGFAWFKACIEVGKLIRKIW